MSLQCRRPDCRATTCCQQRSPNGCPAGAMPLSAYSSSSSLMAIHSYTSSRSLLLSVLVNDSASTITDASKAPAAAKLRASKISSLMAYTATASVVRALAWRRMLADTACASAPTRAKLSAASFPHLSCGRTAPGHSSFHFACPFSLDTTTETPEQITHFHPHVNVIHASPLNAPHILHMKRTFVHHICAVGFTSNWRSSVSKQRKASSSARWLVCDHRSYCFAKFFACLRAQKAQTPALLQRASW